MSAESDKLIRECATAIKNGLSVNVAFTVVRSHIEALERQLEEARTRIGVLEGASYDSAQEVDF